MKLSRLLVASAAMLGLGAVGVAALPASPAAATPAGDDVVINEVYAVGGSANAPFQNKFVELYNPTDAAISLDGWSIHYRSATGTANSSSFGNLSGSIPAGGHYLIQGGSNGSNGAALPTPDATVAGLNIGGASGVVYLSSTTGAQNPGTGDLAGADTVVDLVGFGTANTYEGTAAPALGGTGDQRSAQRTDGVDTDDNANDFSRAQPSPQNSGGQSSGPGDPEDPEEPAEPGEELAISEIQGTGDASPYVGDTVTTQGVVTAVYATGGLNGFNIQEPGAVDLDAHDASTGIFIYGSSFVGSVSIGDSVSVTGLVGEYFGSTQITATSVSPLDTALAPVEPAPVAWPETDAERELFEHMLIDPAGDYIVNDNYELNRFGEIGLAVGTEPLVNPTQVGEPGSAEAIAQRDDNEARGVILDDGNTTEYTRFQSGSMINAHIPLPYLRLDNPVTVGAPVTFTSPVVVHYSHESYRFQPTVPVTGDNPGDEPAAFGDVRETAPENVGGDITIGTFNVLNYFTSLGVDHCSANQNYKDRDRNPITANNCLPRGAWDAENLARQQVKIVNAINALDSSIVSLEEIEDSSDFGLPRDTALSTLVDALNDAAGTEKWAFVPSPATIPSRGDDVIRTAFIYQPAEVSTSGESVILDHSAFGNGRAPLSQAFVDEASDETFVVIVNHFKSKGGSGSGDNANNDESVTADLAVGGWNGDRTRQAAALVAFAEAQEAANGTEFSFLVGDFNAYAKETPATTIEAGGYVNVTSTMTDEYSYLFGGVVGSLDHVYASDAVMEHVTGADIWSINANEAIALEYSRYNYNAAPLYDESVYRSSDHNPAVVGLQFTETPIETPPTTETPDEPTVSTVDSIGDEAFLADGITVNAAGFAAGEPISVSVVYPDGTTFDVDFDDPSITTPGDDGTVSFQITPRTLVPAGVYEIVLAQGDLTAGTTFEVTSEGTTVPPTTPGDSDAEVDGNGDASTGGDDTDGSGDAGGSADAGGSTGTGGAGDANGSAGTGGSGSGDTPPGFDGGLATTGGEVNTGIVVGGLAALLLGAGLVVLLMRRRAQA